MKKDATTAAESCITGKASVQMAVMFKYADSCGQAKYVYSWRLDKNDGLRQGGRGIYLCVRKKNK